MKDLRKKDAQWQIRVTATGNAVCVQQAQLSVLMDLRDELKAMNRFLKRICSNTAKPRKKAE